MTGNILYSFRRCPYAMRARLALKISEISYEHREIILRDKPASMLAVSPKATVPVFITQSGRVIDESLDLMQWALAQNDPNNWLGKNQAETLKLIAGNDGPFKHHLDRYKYPSRYGDSDRGATDPEHRDKAFMIIADYESRLRAHDNLIGDAASLADFAIFPFVRQFANADRDWWDSASFPKTQAWLERHLSSALFQSVMTKHPLWTE